MYTISIDKSRRNEIHFNKLFLCTNFTDVSLGNIQNNETIRPQEVSHITFVIRRRENKNCGNKLNVMLKGLNTLKTFPTLFDSNVFF